MKKSIASILAILVVASMILAACTPPATPTAAPAEPTKAPAPVEPTKAPEATKAPAVEPTKAPEAPAAQADPAGQELADAYAGKFKGKVVTMEGPFTDNDAVVFEKSIKEFEDKTGIDIQYSGSKEFEAKISISVDGGSAPDIADFPQPGLLASFVKKGKVIAADSVISADWLKQNYKQSWLDMATMPTADGKTEMAGIWARFNGKSLVWYPKAEFDAAGYKVPQTWDELMTLTETIAKDGDTPWCIGIASGAATGWAMTDWIEDLMLRTTTPENYDKWVKGELKFDSPEVRKAVEYVTKIWFEDKYVFGGRKSIPATNFGDAPKPMFDKPVKCWLHRQGNFITTFFPEGKKAGTDYDFFYLPPIDPAVKPFLVAGDIYAMFNDRPEVRAVFQYFSKGESLKGWMAAGGALSPHNDASLDWYGSDLERGIAKIAQDANVVRFDASDLMPGAVGAGSFWKKMTDFVSGNVDEDTALKEIDASWPAAATQAQGTGAAGAAAAGQELTDALAGKFKGTVVTMEGPFTDNDAVVFEKSIKEFEDKTGIDIQYSGSKEFEAKISISVDGGSAPDIADFPQPGLLASFVKKGKVIAADSVISADWLKQNYKQSWLDMATMPTADGKTEMAGIWARFNGKSLVWYPKAEFDAAGYKVPQTWDELMTLTETIAKDGDTPWCIGIASGAATGWAMTDWIEDLMLRTTTPENYDKWVKGELKFDSPEVRKAVEYVTKIWFEDKYVFGGRKSIPATNFGDAPKPMFDKPVKCWLHRQGNFITTFFPEGKKAGTDYDFFYLPPIDPAVKPFLVAGDIYAMFNDRPEVRAVFQYFSKGESLKGWMAAGGALSPHNDASLDWYGSDLERGIAKIAQDANVVRFDASDLMPGAVGAGSFWKKMTDFVSGNVDEDTALKEIDASWPK